MSQRLGQHFLTDPTILDRIVDALEPDAGDVVVEIGAGEGTLTRRLAPRVARVVAIERDPVLGARLRAAVPAAVGVVIGDALELSWSLLAGNAAPSAPPPPFKVIGNIPYYITSPLIDRALTPPLPVTVVFLMQREVADRVSASPGSRAYGALSVGVQTVALVERLFLVRAGAFRPPPAVDSAVVRLRPRADRLVPPDGLAAFRRFVTAVFGQRRKQIGRIMRSVANRPKPEAEAGLIRLGIDPAIRPEVLTPQEFVRLFREFGR